MGFKNPIPDIDDIREAKRFIISPVFTYEQEMTLEEAAEKGSYATTEGKSL